MQFFKVHTQLLLIPVLKASPGHQSVGPQQPQPPDLRCAVKGTGYWVLGAGNWKVKSGSVMMIPFGQMAVCQLVPQFSGLQPGLWCNRMLLPHPGVPLWTTLCVLFDLSGLQIRAGIMALAHKFIDNTSVGRRKGLIKFFKINTKEFHFASLHRAA